MGFNSNISDRVPSRISDGAIEVYSLRDLPDPSGGVITLPSGLYIFKAPVNFGTDTIDITGNSVQMYTENSFVNALTYEGTGTFINATAASSLRVFYPGITFVLSGDGATFIDLVGSFGMQFSSILFTHVNGGDLGIISGGDTGALTSARFFMTRCLIRDWVTGMQIRDTSRSYAEDSNIFSHANATGALINLLNQQEAFYFLGTECVLNNANSSFFNVDPTNTKSLYANNNVISGLGTFFNVGISGTFTAVADTGITAETITSVTDQGGIAEFNHGGAPIFLNQRVTIADFVTNTTYNDTFIVTSAGPGVFQVGIAFTGTEASVGNYSSNTVRMTEVGTALSNGDTVTIDTDLSTDYDGGSYVFDVDTNDFQINIPGNDTFSVTRTGLWTTDSLDETSPNIEAVANTGVGDSTVTGFAFMNGNVATTAVTDGVYTVLDLTGLVAKADDEGMKLVDNVEGVYEYTHDTDCPCDVTITIWATKSGSTGNYRFASMLGGVLPTFDSESDGYTPMEVKTTQVGAVHIDTFNFVNGGVYQLAIAGDGTADDPTITDIKIEIK